MPLPARIVSIVLLASCASPAGGVTPPSPRLLESARKEGRALALPEGAHAPAHGAATGGDLLVVLCDTGDRPADRRRRDAAWFRERFAGEARSVSAHWREATRGRVSFRADVRGWYRLPGSAASYAADLDLFARSALAALPGDIDWSRFDWDGDGEAEGVVVVHSGQGAEVTGAADEIWSQVRPFRPGEHDPPVAFVAHVPEESRLGVYAHETGHLLGLPDLYDRSLQSMGLGIWSLMAYGSWAGDGEAPVGLDGWSLARLGLPVDEAPGDGPWGVRFCADSPGPIRIASVADPRERFIATWRSRTGIDSLLPGEGLEILHVNDRYRGNDGPGRYQVALEQADGLFQLERSSDFRGWGDGGDLYPGSTDNRAFHAGSVPSSRLERGLRSGVTLVIRPTEEGVEVEGTSLAPLAAELEVQSVALVGSGTPGRAVPGVPFRLRVGIQNRGNAPWDGGTLRIEPVDPDLIARRATAELAALDVGEWTDDGNAPEFELEVEGRFRGAGRTTVRILPDSIWFGEPPAPVVRIAPPERPGWPVPIEGGWGTGGAVIAGGSLIAGDRAGRLFRIYADGTRAPFAELGGVTAGRCAAGDMDGDGFDEVAAATEGGSVYLLDHDGRTFPGWPVDLGVACSEGPALIREPGGTWTVAVSAGAAMHRLDRAGVERGGWPVVGEGRLGRPALLEDGGQTFLAAGDAAGLLHLYWENGDERAGWPVDLGAAPSSGVVTADFGGSALVVACADGRVHAFRPDGSPFPGWPVATGDANTGSSLAACDVDGDGYDEVAAVFSRTCRLLERHGEMPAGWPAELEPGAHLPVLMADMDGERGYEIVTGSASTGWSVRDAAGRLLPGWPLSTEGLAGRALLADLDRDGSWELYADDSRHGWRAFLLAGEAGERAVWPMSGGDPGATGNPVPPEGGAPDLEITVTDSGSFREGVWARDPVDLPLVVTNRGDATSEAATLRYRWSGDAEGPIDAVTISALPPGVALIVNLPVVLPYREEEETSLTVEIGPVPGEADPRNNSALVPWGPTVPGSPFAVEGPPGLAPTEIDYRDGILYRAFGGWIVPYDLVKRRELDGRAMPGAEIAAGDGRYLAVSGGRIRSVDLDDGAAAVLSRPGSVVCCPDGAGENPVWLEERCGGEGTIAIFFPGDDHVGYVPCRHRIDGGPVLAGEVAYWIEREGGVASLIRYPVSGGSRRTLYADSGSVGPLACDSTGVVFVRSGGERIEILFADRESDTVRVVARRDGAVESLAMDGGVALWSERRGGGVDLFAARARGGRVLPVCLAPGDQTMPALWGGTAVWLDGRVSPAVCRGIRLRADAFDPREEATEDSAGSVSFQLNYLHVHEDSDRVLLEWRVVRGGDRGSYGIYRGSRRPPRFEDAEMVFAGDLRGDGYYAYEDSVRGWVVPGTTVHYFLELRSSDDRLLAGPKEIRIGEEVREVALLRAGPNPVVRRARFALALPGGEAAVPDVFRLEVYDIAGRRIHVRPLTAGPGITELDWDLRDGSGRRVAPGVYFLRVSRGGRAIGQQKVVVLGG